MNNNYINTLTSQEKEIFIKTIYVLARINDNLDQEEINHMKNLSRMYSFSSEELKEILTSNPRETILEDVKMITDGTKALQLIKEMFFLTNADGEISDDEIDFIIEVANTLEIDLEQVKLINRWVVDYLVLEEEAKILFEKAI